MRRPASHGSPDTLQATPQSQPNAQHPRGLARVTRRECLATLLNHAAEAIDVKLARLDAQQVPVAARVL